MGGVVVVDGDVVDDCVADCVMMKDGVVIGGGIVVLEVVVIAAGVVVDDGVIVGENVGVICGTTVVNGVAVDGVGEE